MAVKTVDPEDCARDCGTDKPCTPIRGRSTGTLAPQEANRVLAVLDFAVKKLGVPGLQAAARFEDDSHWTGVSGTADADRRTPHAREAGFRVGRLTNAIAGNLSVFDVASLVSEIERACHHGTAVERSK